MFTFSHRYFEERLTRMLAKCPFKWFKLARSTNACALLFSTCDFSFVDLASLNHSNGHLANTLVHFFS